MCRTTTSYTYGHTRPTLVLVLFNLTKKKRTPLCVIVVVGHGIKFYVYLTDLVFHCVLTVIKFIIIVLDLCKESHYKFIFTYSDTTRN